MWADPWLELQGEHMFAYTLFMLLHLPEHLQSRMPPDPSRAGLVAEIEALSAAQCAIDSYRHRLVAAIDSLPDKGIDGAEVLRMVGRGTSRDAHRVARSAKLLAKLPSSSDALAGGAITSHHADVLADASKRVEPGLVDSELLEIAVSLGADLFAKRAREWVADHESSTNTKKRQKLQRDRRSVSSWIDREGMKLWLAKLAPDEAAAVGASLGAEYERLWRLDGGRDLTPSDPRWRTPQQRMADAFTNLITRRSGAVRSTGSAADVAGGGGAGGGAPHVRQQMLSIVDLSRMRAHDPTGLAGVTDGSPLPQSVLERLACISDITGVIFDGPGRPIWVGRSRRSASIAQWKALIARDRGCVGCGADPNRCEAHHIEVWSRGGPTDITNLVLVCSRCHHNIHDREMQLVPRQGGGWQIAARDGPVAVGVAA